MHLSDKVNQTMLAIDDTFLDFKQLDLLAMRDAVHRLDPRAKVLTTPFFILCRRLF